MVPAAHDRMRGVQTSSLAQHRATDDKSPPRPVTDRWPEGAAPCTDTHSTLWCMHTCTASLVQTTRAQQAEAKTTNSKDRGWQAGAPLARLCTLLFTPHMLITEKSRV